MGTAYFSRRFQVGAHFFSQCDPTKDSRISISFDTRVESKLRRRWGLRPPSEHASRIITYSSRVGTSSQQQQSRITEREERSRMISHLHYSLYGSGQRSFCCVWPLLPPKTLRRCGVALRPVSIVVASPTSLSVGSFVRSFGRSVGRS